jgi:hypothetical protein
MTALRFSIDLILPALVLTQPLTEMFTRNLTWGKWRPARKADLTAIYETIVWRKCGNLDVSQSYWLSRPVTGVSFSFFYIVVAVVVVVSSSSSSSSSGPNRFGLDDEKEIHFSAPCLADLHRQRTAMHFPLLLRLLLVRLLVKKAV